MVESLSTKYNNTQRHSHPKDGSTPIGVVIYEPAIHPHTDRSTAMKTMYEILTPESAMPLGPDYRNSVGMVFKRIHPGTFLMGSPDSEEDRRDNEGPQHAVTIANGFWLQDTPVTRQQYRDVLGEDPSHFKHDWDCPVEAVSWDDCQRFIAALNAREGTKAYRLPSESEWEYACRAGTTGPFSFDLPITTDKANYNGNYSYAGGPKGEYREKTTPVRQFDANPWGLYDVHGNVWEWCQDTWHENYVGAPCDGQAWTVGEETFRVLRGGSWGSNPRFLRSAIRVGNTPVIRNFGSGFRLVRTLFTP